METQPADPDPQAAPKRLGRVARARRSSKDLQLRARDGFEQARSRSAGVQMAAEAFEHDRARAGGLLAGGLAYRVFLWQLPLSLFLLSALGLATELAGADPADLARRVGMTAALSGAIAKGAAASGSERVWLLFLGAFLTIWAGRGVYRGLRLVSELAWGVRGPRGSSLRGSLAVTGVALIGEAMQVALPRAWSAIGLPGLAEFLLGLVLASAFATWAISLLPRADARWTAVVPGGIVFGIGLRLLGVASATWFAYRLERSGDLYGAIGIAIVLMLYLYLLARLFVGVQFLNATLYRRRTGDRSPGPAAVSSASVGARENGGDHHPESGAPDEVVGQVRADVHPPEPDGRNDRGETGSNRPG